MQVKGSIEPTLQQCAVNVWSIRTIQMFSLMFTEDSEG